MAQWKPLNSSLNKRGNNDFSGGLDIGQSPFNINDNASTDEYGWDFEDYPSLRVRRGRTSYGASGAAVTRLLVNYKTTRMLRAVGTVVQTESSGVWSNLETGLTDTDWNAVNFRDSLIMTNGTDNVKVYNGTTLADLNTNAPKGKFVTQHDNRVYILKDRTISYCALGDPTDWVTVDDAGSINMSTPNGELGTAITSYNGYVIGFSANYYSKLYGKGPDDYELLDGYGNIGCASFKTIQNVNGILYWMDQRGVYSYDGGVPVDIAQPVRPYLTSLNLAQIDKCFGGTYDKKYYLGLVTGTNIEPNVLLVYDPRSGRNKWRVQSLITDLRYSTIFNGLWYNGGSSGQTYLMNSGDTDDGVAIPYSITSKPFNEQYPEAEKEYYEMHMQGEFPSTVTLGVSVSTDDQGSNFTAISYDPITTSSLTTNKNLIIPMDTVPLAYWMRYKIAGTGRVRIVGVQRYARVQPVQI